MGLELASLVDMKLLEKAIDLITLSDAQINKQNAALNVFVVAWQSQ